MAYVSSLTHGAQIPVRSFAKAGEYVLKAPIGFDDQANVVYGIFLCLASVPGFTEEHYELAFNLTKSEDGEPSTYWDGLETKAWVPDAADRTAILSIAVQGVIDLVEVAKPEMLTMTTYVPDLPQKALRKYARIIEAVEGRGYRTEAMEEWRGQLGWKMYRNP